MKEHRNENMIAIAPTGSGKTEGAILWLDDHKGFYTLPLKVSAGAIYHRIYDTPCDKRPACYGFEQVGLLHSDSLAEYMDASEPSAASDDPENASRRTLGQYRSVRNLAWPLTITTVDQLFKFVFKAVGTEIFAATLKYSRIVIDEMQMYDPKILAMLVYGLKIVSRLGGQFAIITATLPGFVQNRLQLEKVPFVSDVFPGNERRHVLKIQPDEFRDSFDLNAIREAGKTSRVLVICNTVRRAQELKRQLPEARLLHSKFIRSERRRLEDEIFAFQDNRVHPGSVGIWIATQIVEASLDIDFDVLHMELCTADSLLQRLGRCWRSRTYDRSEPNVYIYDHGECGIYDADIFARSKRFLAAYLGRIFTEQEKLDYINAVFDEHEIQDSRYYGDFKKRLNEIRNILPTMYSRAEAEKYFRDIQSVSVVPDSVYNAHIDEINEAIDVINDKRATLEARYKARQNLQHFTVSVNRYGRDSRFVDKNPIMAQPLSGTDIYRTRAVYSSIDGTLTDGPAGLGLLAEESLSDSFL